MARFVTWHTILSAGVAIAGRCNPRFFSTRDQISKFRSLFGCHPVDATDLWCMTRFTNRQTEIKHCLWGLMEMKVCSTDETMAKLANVDPKTYQKWSWDCIIDMSAACSDLIKWNDRFKPGPLGPRIRTCYVTVDDTDCKMSVPIPFSKIWSSHKFGKKAGVRCEIAVSIQTGEIVWINGPFACGMWPDLNIFRSALKWMLGPNEMVEADKAFRDPKRRTPYDRISRQDNRARADARARHECVNKKFKSWSCLKQAFRHPLWKRKCCFRAIAALTQLAIRRGEVPFHVNC